MKMILRFAAATEVGTGLFLTIDPSLVIFFLLGPDTSGCPTSIGRIAGAALIGLGLACWPIQQCMECKSSAFRGMLAYNGLVAIYLAYLGLVIHTGGPLLWPGVALHTAVVLSLVWTKLNPSRTKVDRAA
jgi:hypothetical protein